MGRRNESKRDSEIGREVRLDGNSDRYCCCCYLALWSSSTTTPDIVHGPSLLALSLSISKLPPEILFPFFPLNFPATDTQIHIS